ncbi:MAG: SsrA-binding protein SmpB [Patescibacteria group bacterium]
MKLNNRKATYDYEILDRFEAGVHLSGHEVKSLRGGHAKLEGSYVRIIGSEAYLVGAEIYPYQFARVEGYDPKRTRKLLFHKKEIIGLKTKLESANLTLVPLSWYTRGSLIKLEVGLGRGKKEYQKREAKRREDQRRELEIEFRGKIK